MALATLDSDHSPSLVVRSNLDSHSREVVLVAVFDNALLLRRAVDATDFVVVVLVLFSDARVDGFVRAIAFALPRLVSFECASLRLLPVLAVAVIVQRQQPMLALVSSFGRLVHDVA